MTAIGPVTLEGRHVTLVPTNADHAPALAEAAGSDDLHRTWYTKVPAPEEVPAEIARRLTLLAQNQMVPFTVLDPGGTPVGMTTYMNIKHATPRLEIGHTWLGKRAQRTLINTEAKRLLLAHAFETIGCIAVEFCTHYMNFQSRAAIERLGARLDGVLRHHQILSDGTIRDTAVYSIIRPEWPAVRANLDWKLSKPRNSDPGTN